MISPRWPNGFKVELGDAGVFSHNGNGLDGFCIGRVVQLQCEVLTAWWVNTGNCCSEHGPEDLVGWIPPGAAALIPAGVDVRVLSASDVAGVLSVIGCPVPPALVAELVAVAS